MKKSVIQLFSYSVIIMLFSMTNTFAQEPPLSGPCGNDLEWNFSDYTLTISGTGDMWNYMPPEGGPWPKSIKTLVIEKGVTSIGRAAFFDCSFSSVSMANTVTKIGSNAFTMCRNLKSIELPNSVAVIGDYAFSESGFTTMSFPNGVINIGRGIFYMCYHLTSVTLPNSVKSIGGYAFSGCPLTSITNLNPVPLTIDTTVFHNVDIRACTLYVPPLSVPRYKKAEVWKEFNIVGGVDIDEEETDEGGGNRLLVYPNPATGACSITMPDEFLYERFLTLSVYDASGKLIQQIQIDNDSPEKVSLKLDHKAQGMYVVTLSNGVRSYTGKVVFN